MLLQMAKFCPFYGCIIFCYTHTHTHVCVCICAKSFQSCPTICNPMDCSPPDSSIHGILQARILEWIAMPSSRESSQPRDGTWVFKSPAWVDGFFTASATWEAYIYIYIGAIYIYIYIYILLYITYTHIFILLLPYPFICWWTQVASMSWQF